MSSSAANCCLELEASKHTHSIGSLQEAMVALLTPVVWGSVERISICPEDMSSASHMRRDFLSGVLLHLAESLSAKFPNLRTVEIGLAYCRSKPTYKHLSRLHPAHASRTRRIFG